MPTGTAGRTGGERPPADPGLGRTLARSAAAGVGAYLVAFAVVATTFALDVSRTLGVEGGDGSAVQAVQRLGWVVYNAHLVRTRAWLSLNFIDLAAGSLSLPAVWYYAVPPLVLVGAGWLAARDAPAGATRVLAGAALVGGYLPAATLGAVAVTTSEGGPEFVTAVLLAGIVYPVACGTVGGLIADR